MSWDHENQAAIKADTVLRTFVAAEIGDPVRAALATEQDRLRTAGARVGWVAPENLHLSLAFLGDLFGAALAGLAQGLDGVARATRPFTLDTVGLGAFGAPGRPRVLWAGAQAADAALPALYARLRAVLAELDLRLEDRPFHPHLTLGRVKSGDRAAALTGLIQSDNNRSYGATPVTRILLMRSRLAPQGARYTILHAATLKGE